MDEASDHIEVAAVLAEGAHTAFRKGCSGGRDVWKELQKMDQRDYQDAITWLVESLDFMGYEIRKKQS